ncbi:INTEGRAL MEMBRANE PROTEIN (Rhomboid family) [hydrothermal vent metagenome]|uniref:INTEGRAL MEMBRANE PROTEIN (Rhomboid family) n=1 Tax=hydrothermal vent metagenome TaxID=652676 RepID=A0A3B0TMJ5_9ZZZZ
MTFPPSSPPSSPPSPPPSANPPAVNAPRVVLWLIAALTVIHVIRQIIPESTDIAVLRYFAFIPARFTTEGLSHFGGLPAALWSWVSYNFLHGGYGHLIVNAVWMLAFGSAVAWRVGPKRFMAFSLVCGGFGALFYLVFRWGAPYPMIGASAMISGQMAAAIRFVFRDRGTFGSLGRGHSQQRYVPLATVVEVFQDKRSFAFVAIWAVINLGIGISSLSFGGGIAWEAHIGGFVAGLLLFGYFDPPPPPNRSYFLVE